MNRKSFIPALLSLTLLAGCKLGLGGAVDVNPPELTITAPAAKSVVNGDITITGTVSDDMGMSKVTIDLKGISHGEGYSYPATLDPQDGTWSLKIPTTSVVDDDYNIVVTATDLAKKNTTVERVIEIDNTAPVIVIERPNSTIHTADDIDSYGTSLVISGNVVDDHDIEEMWFTVYDKYGFPIPDGSIRFTNSPQKFEHATGSEFYEKIYGKDPAGVKEYRYAITAKDSAGNISTCFYLLDELNSLNSKNADITATAKNIHAAYKNKEFEGDLIRALRSGDHPLEHQVTDKEGSFTLNKSLTPYYTVSGMETINIRDGLSNVLLKGTCGSIYNKDNQITITLSSNLDGDLVAVYDSENRPLITVYAVQFDQIDKNADGALIYKKLITTAGRQELVSITKDDDWYALNIATTPNKKTVNVRLDNSLNSKNGGIQTGKYYAIRVVGKDTAGNTYEENDTPFIFKLEGKGAQPELTVTQPAGPVYVGIGASLVVKGTAVSHDDDDDEWVRAALYDGQTSLPFEGSEQIAGTWKKKFQKSGASIPIDSIVLSKETLNELFGNLSGSKILTLKVNDKSEKTIAKEINVTYDIGKPEITFSSVSPTVVIGDTEYVNGSITVKGSINDNEDLIGKAWYQINGGVKTAIQNPNSFSISIDTTQYPDNTALKVMVTAQDRSGNENSNEKEIHVNQSSDKPQITLSNGDISQNAFDPNNITKNVFGTNQNNQFQGTVTDDDGIASVVLYTCKADETLSQTNGTAVSGIIASSTNAQFSVRHGKTAEGEYKGQFVVTDINGKKTETEIFWFAVDNGSPQIAFDGTSVGQLRPAGGTVDVKLSLADGSGAVTITAETTSTDTAANTALAKASDLLKKGTTGIEITDLAAGYTDTVSIPTSSLNYEITYTATDRYGNSSSVVFTFMVDSDKPTISVNWGDGDENPTKAKPLACLDKTGQFSFNGTAKDKVGQADGIISAVKYQVMSADNTVSKEYTANGTGSFSAIIDFKNDVSLSGCADQEVTIVVTAYDAAGNASEPQSITIGVDSEEPWATTEMIGGDADKYSKDFRLVGSVVSDFEDVEHPVTLTITKGPFSKIIDYEKIEITPEDELWEADFAVPDDFAANPDTDGVYTLIIRTVDKYGRTGITTDYLTIDTTAPVVTITSPKAGEWQNDTAVTVSGTVTDGIGVGTRSLWYKKSVDAEEQTEITSFNASTGTWSFTYTLDDAEGADAATVYIQAEDKVGNVSEPATLAINLDKSAPVVQSASYQKKGQASAVPFSGTLYVNDEFTVSGTVTDTYKLQSVTVTAKKDDGTTVVRSSENQTVKVTQVTADSDSAWNWNTTFAKDSLSEGTWEIRVDAKDAAGKSATAKTYTVMTDFTEPVIKDDETLSWPSKEDTKASSYTFQGEISEDGSGIQNGNVTLTISDGTDGHVVSPVVSGTTSWSAKIKYSEYGAKAFGAEGLKTVTITATDRAGNVGTLTKTFVYDTADPSITGLNQQNGNGLPSAGTSLTAKVADTLQLKQVTVDQYFNDSKTPVTLTYTDDDGDSTTMFKGLDISQVIPFASNGQKVTPETGTYRYVITATDSVNNETSWEASLVADLEAPSITITAPAEDTTNTGVNAVNVTNFSFDGTTADEGLGVTAVYWQITAADAETPDDGKWSSSINGTLASWKVFQEFKAKGAEGSGLEEGSYKFWAYSEDKAGNVSEPVSRTFDVDLAYPEVTAGVVDKNDTAISAASTNDKNFAFTYTASDTAGFAANNPVVTVYKDGDVMTTGYTGDNGKITFGDDENEPADGQYKLTVSATDIFGKKTEKSVEILLDTAGPDIEVTSPDLSEWQTKASFKISGTTSDVSGIKDVSYKLSSDESWTLITGKSSWNVDYTLPEGTTFNTGKIFFKATDTLGNESIKSYDLTVDAEAPVIGETRYIGQPSDNTLYNNGSIFVRMNDDAADDETETITITGSVTDNVGISNVVLVAEKGSTRFLINLKDGTNANGEETLLVYNVDSTNENKQWDWSINLPFKMFKEDGTWTFKYSLIDVSGQEATQFTSLMIDRAGPTGITAERKSSPAYTITTGEGEQQVKTLWYQSTAMQYVVTASDVTSGISTIEYSTDGGLNWIPLTLANSTYTCTVNFPVTSATQGANTVRFRVTDRAGNISYGSDAPLFDTAAPLDVVVKSGETGQKLVNSSSDVVFYVEAKDAHSDKVGKSTGIKLVRVAKLGSSEFQADDIGAVTTPDTEGDYAGYYKLTIPAAKLATGAIVVETEDNAGNKNQTTLFQLNFDDERPDVTISNISDADPETKETTEVNGTIIVHGTSSDNQFVQRVKVEYSTDNVNWTEYAQDKVTGTYNWSVTVDTTALDDEKGKGKLYFRATAIDSASNETEHPATAAVLIDQNTDRPVITLNNMALSGMNRASNPAVPAWFKQRQFYGTITDDDGVKQLQITYTKTDDATVTGTKDITVSGSSFEFSFTDAETGSNLPDGTYSLTFSVIDESSVTGTTFTSDGDNKPRVRDSATLVGGKDKVTEDTAILVTLDTQAPTIGKVSITTDLNADGSPKAAARWKDSDYDQIKLGGTTTKFAARFTLSDTSGIKDVTDNDASSGLMVKLSGAHTYTVPSGDITNDGTTYTVKNIPAATGTGRLVLNLTAQDNASATREDSVALTVDNTAPVVSFTTTQSKFNGGASETLNGTVDTSATLSFAVTKDPDTPPAAWSPIKTGSGYWGLTFDGSDPTVTPEHTKRLNNYLINLYKDEVSDIEDTIADKSYKAITDLYVWIKAVDECGNISDTSKFLMKVDPQGDIPVVTIENPERDATKPQNVMLIGGKPKIFGSAEDPAGTTLGITSVWVQLMSERQSNTAATAKLAFTDYDTITTFNYGKAEIDFLASQGYDIYNMNTYVPGSSEKWVSGTSDKAPDENYTDYAILVVPTGGSSWNLRINENSEFNPDTDNGVTTNAVGIRVWAKDADRILSVPVDRVMRFDADKPVIGEEVPLYVVQSSKGAWDSDETYSASMQYKEGMYLTGTNWYLIGSVSDNAVKLLELGNDKLVNNTVQPTDGSVVVETVESNQNREVVRFKYPLTMNGEAGEINFMITAQDDSEHEITQQIKLKYDNKAPELVDSTDTENYGLRPNVQQSNYFYHLTSMVKEAPVNGVSQSGLDKVAFYFLRRDLTEKDSSQKTVEKDMIYNPLLAKTNTNRKISIDGAILKADISTTGEKPTADGTVVYDQGLYWLYKTVTRDSNTLSALELTSANDNIHKDSLVQMGGALYTVDNVTGTSVILNGNPDAQYTYALFALASIVDNTIQESAGTTREADGYYTKPINDDGDRMQEYIDNAAAGYVWSAYISSRNIPDGPIEIHYVAFDKAGNYSHGVVANEAADVYKTRNSLDAQEYKDNANAIAVYEYDADNPAYVSNNAPRIAKVRLGTDLKGNGAIDEWYDAYKATDTDAAIVPTDNLYDEKAVLEKMLTSVTIGDASNAYKTLRGYTEIDLDIVGGNGALSYAYDIPAATGGSALKGENRNTSLGTGSVDYSVSSLKNIVLQAGDLSKIGDSANRAFKIEVWDSTEGTIQFDNSAHADITLYLGVAIADTTPPEATITPFYWNSLSDNSINGSNANTTKATLKGHIELEDDLPAVFKDTANPTTVTQKLMDRDPKVSGEIVIKGHAHDNKLLKNIYMKVPGMESHFTGMTQHKTNSQNDGWYLMANYADGKWSKTDKWAEHGFTFEIVAGSESFADGHDVDWTFTWDTSKINGIAAVDVEVQVMAEDWGKPTYAAATKGTSGATESITGADWYSGTPTYTDLKTSTAGTYRMDVVPYITMVETTLSSIKDNNPSVYDRTSTGHYPVWVHQDSPTASTGAYTTSAETVKIYGFNLAGGVAYDTDDNCVSSIKDDETEATPDPMAAGTRIKASATFGAKGTIYYSVPVTNFVSGDIRVTVNSVDSLNNLNNDVAEYNKRPNGDNNNNLTDGVVFDVWQLNSAAARPRANGDSISDVAMAINPSSKMVDFAFPNGSTFFSFANGTTNSYQTWSQTWDDYMGPQILATSAGVTHGIEIGQDTNATSTDAGTVRTGVYRGVSSNMNYISSTLGVTTTGTKSVTSWTSYEYQGSNAKRLEKLGLWGYVNSTDTQTSQVVNKRRIPSSSIAYSTSGKVYLAYSDMINNQIRFRYDGQLEDIENTAKSNDGKTQTGMRDARISAWSVVAGYKQSIESEKNRSLVNDYHAGKYVAIDVVSGTTSADDTVVLVWYDATDKKLMYSYKFDPCNDYDMNQDSKYGDHDTLANRGYWSEPLEIFDGAGEFCKIKVDSDGGIHIAAYDTADADVRYAYLSNYYSKTVNSCTVDSTDILGKYLTLDVAKVGEHQIPYIGYYANSIQKPKLAKLSTTAANSYADGVALGAYTGNWDVSVIPTSSTMVEGTINVGVWKNAGSLTTSYRTGTTVGKSYAGTGSGVCYGNGTNNAVLGYAITNASGTGGTIETAQMR